MENLFSMNEKVCLVTGGSSGLGSYMAHGFLVAGASRVYITARSYEKLSAKADELSSLGKGECIPISGDLSSLEGISSLASEIKEREPYIDVLVNNAGLGLATSIDSLEAEDWDRVMDINARSPLFLTQALLPFLKKGKGCIINISDTLAPSGIKNFSLYSGAKSALEGITKSLAKELAPDIRVNAISPGAILWPEDEDLSEDQQKQRLTKVPLGRIGCPEDISSLAVFLSEAEYITGQVIKVDGGRSIN